MRRYFLAIILATSCSKEPPAPYSAEECELARSFVRNCEAYNDIRGIYTYYATEEMIQDEEFGSIVEARKALGVSDRRSWWCQAPQNANLYVFKAIMSPPLESCCSHCAGTRLCVT